MCRRRAVLYGNSVVGSRPGLIQLNIYEFCSNCCGHGLFVCPRSGMFFMLGCFFGGRGRWRRPTFRFGSSQWRSVLCCVARARARGFARRVASAATVFQWPLCKRHRERERGLIKIHLKVKLNEMPYAVSLGESADRRGPPAVTRTSVIRVTI